MVNTVTIILLTTEVIMMPIMIHITMHGSLMLTTRTTFTMETSITAGTEIIMMVTMVAIMIITIGAIMTLIMEKYTGNMMDHTMMVYVTPIMMDTTENTQILVTVL